MSLVQPGRLSLYSRHPSVIITVNKPFIKCNSSEKTYSSSGGSERHRGRWITFGKGIRAQENKGETRSWHGYSADIVRLITLICVDLLVPLQTTVAGERTTESLRKRSLV